MVQRLKRIGSPSGGHLYIAVLALSAAVFPHAAFTAGTELRATAIEPVIELERGEVAACGIRAAVAGPGGGVSVALRLVRDASSNAGTRFHLDASDTAADAATLSPVNWVAGDHDYISHFAPAGTLSMTANLTPLEGATLMRDLMLSGARVDLERSTGHTVQVVIQGPVANSVRAAYLNCAGDLIKPTP